jgi:hypothetical protein
MNGTVMFELLLFQFHVACYAHVFLVVISCVLLGAQLMFLTLAA